MKPPAAGWYDDTNDPMSHPIRHSLLALALLSLSLLLRCGGGGSRPGSREHPSIVLISIDTLRADHLPAYGYRGVATPAIDALGRDGVIYDEAYSHCPLTLPSHVSILTGLLPQDHGVRDNAGYALDAKSHPTVASLLAASGYATGAAVSAYVLRASSGIANGFQWYDDPIPVADNAAIGSMQRRGSETIASAESWIDAHADRPFFLFVHLYEPHAPYDPPQPWLTRYGRSYDGEIATSDALVGHLVNFLKAKSLYDDTVIVLLSDHGEGLMDHGEQEHGLLLYREALRVPLIVKLPGSHASSRRQDTVELIDVAPTLCELAHVRPAAGMHGRSLTAAPGAPRPVISETLYPRIHFGWSELRSVIDQDRHFIESPHPELYLWARDPAEKRNAADADRRSVAELRRVLDVAGRRIDLPSKVNREEAAKLASLGYVSAVSSTQGHLDDPKEHLGDLERLKSAEELIEERKFAEAVPLLERMLAENPRWSDVRDELGDTYEILGEYDKAVATYRRGIELNPELTSDFAVSLASVYLKEHKFDEAEAHAKLALRADPPVAHQMLGEIALEKGDLATAEREAAIAMAEPTEVLEAVMLLARVDAVRKNYDSAIGRLDEVRVEALKRHTPLPPHFFHIRGDIFGHMGRLDDAERDFRREIAGYPENLEAYSSLALLFSIGQKRDAALAVLEQMAAANPGPKALLAAATDLDEWGDHATAAKWRARAKKALPPAHGN
jgi:choline-sulfatase